MNPLNIVIMVLIVFLLIQLLRIVAKIVDYKQRQQGRRVAMQCQAELIKRGY
jgi:uncharacterized protein HemY